MAKNILNFHFDYLTTPLMVNVWQNFEDLEGLGNVKCGISVWIPANPYSIGQKKIVKDYVVFADVLDQIKYFARVLNGWKSVVLKIFHEKGEQFVFVESRHLGYIWDLECADVFIQLSQDEDIGNHVVAVHQALLDRQECGNEKWHHQEKGFNLTAIFQSTRKLEEALKFVQESGFSQNRAFEKIFYFYRHSPSNLIIRMLD